MTPLQRAANDGDVELCARLVKEGASVDEPGTKGVTALGYAIYRQRTHVIEKLIELGADVNHVDDEGGTPLIYTVHAPFGHSGYSTETMTSRNNIAKMLLAHGAKVNSATNHGDTALHCAAQDRNADLVKLLLDAGADPNLKTSQGYTALDIARFPAYAPNDSAINELQKKRR